MKQIRFTLILLCIIVASSSYALKYTDVKIGKINYTIWYETTDKKDYAEVTSSKEGHYSGEITIPKEITYNNKIYPVTSIGSYAFCNDANVTKVIIPNSVTKIRINAFLGCYGLTALTIPNSVTDIDVDVFRGANLSTLIFEDGDTPITFATSNNCIASKCFQNTKVKELYLGRKIESKDYTDPILGIKETVTKVEFGKAYSSIPDQMFKSSSLLEKVVLPENLKYIGEKAFSSCRKLSEISFPNTIITLCARCFEYCTSLNTINLPSSVITLDDGCFAGCEGVKSINIPSSVKTIGKYAFNGCTGLEKIFIPASVTSIGTKSFYTTNIKQAISLANLSKSVDYVFPETCNLLVPQSQKNMYWKSGNVETIGDITSTLRTIKVTSNNFFELTNASIYDGNNLIEQKVATNSNVIFENLSPEKEYKVHIFGKGFGEDVETFSYVSTQKVVLRLRQSSRTNCTMTIKGDYPTELGNVEFNFGSYGKGANWGSGTYSDGQKIIVTEVVIKNLVPGESIPITFNVTTDQGITYNYTESFSTAAINMYFDTSVSATSCCLKGRYINYDATILESGFKESNSDELKVTGLDPNTSYSRTYYVKTKEGGIVSKTVTFKTKALQLETLQPKGVTNTCSIVSANSNIDDDELTAGFQWRKYDAPSSLKSNEGYATVYGGTLEGFIKNLQTTSYYKVRAFYKSQTDKYYYGEWVTFDPSDFSYFEPTVHTYKSVDVQGSSAVIKGVALQGSDEITEQGFEYWSGGSNARQASTDKQIVYVSGQRMESEITNIAPNTVYYYRAFAKTSKNTTYGETMQFETPITSSINQIVNNDKSKLQIQVKNSDGLQISLTGTEEICSYKVFSMTGNLVSLGTLSADGEWHNVSEAKLPTGIYIIRVCDGKNNASAKIAVK